MACITPSGQEPLRTRGRLGVPWPTIGGSAIEVCALHSPRKSMLGPSVSAGAATSIYGCGDCNRTTRALNRPRCIVACPSGVTVKRLARLTSLA
jgi:hypothetical protein